MAETYKYQNADVHARLRRSARDLIDNGVPPPSHSGTLSVDALQLLYQRASTPESAADALKLLHELQTYQVELDLLYEQLQTNELEITEELAYYRSLYELAPAAYLIVANDGVIIEGNHAAGALFSEPAMPLTGTALNTLLAPGQGGAVRALLGQSPGEGSSAAQATTTVSVELPDHRHLMISTGPGVTGESTLMILTEATAPTARS